MNESFFTTAPSLLKEQLQRFNVQVHPPSFLFHGGTRALDPLLSFIINTLEPPGRFQLGIRSSRNNYLRD